MSSDEVVLEGKTRHASYLFNEMSKFQKCGILCDVTVPGQLNLVRAHRVVLASARSSDGECTMSPSSLKVDDDVFNNSNDVFWLDEAYSSIKSESKTENQLTVSSSESVENRLGALDNLRRQRSLCDVTLETECCKCEAHKVVLAACSGYFRAMFTSAMLEQDMDNIALRGVDGSYLQRVLDFIYSGDLSFEGWEDVVEILKLGVYYQISPLIESCCNHLITNLSSDSACYVAHFGRELALKKLLAKSIQFIHDHFSQLDDADVHIDLLHSDDLINLLESDRLGQESNAGCELKVLRIVLRWLLHHQSIAADVEHNILDRVRFPLIPASDVMRACREIIDECSCDETSVTSLKLSPIFRKHLHKVLQYHEQVYKQPLQDKRTSLRISDKSFVSFDGVLASDTIQLPSDSRYVVEKGAQSSDGPIRDPFHSVVEMNGFIYILGGTRQFNEGYSQVVVRYDPRLDVCIRVADMLEPRGDFVAISYDNAIYVFGGRNRRGALRSCEKYSPASNEWVLVSELPESLYMAAGAVTKGKVYISGGFNNYEAVGHTFCYNPTCDTWDRLPSQMMNDRGYHVMIEASDGRLWVVGGVDNPFSGRNVWEVEAFDVDTQMWNYVGQVLPVKLLLSTLRLNVFLNHKQHICISAVTSSEDYAMLEYDPDTRMWLEMKQRVPMIQMEPECRCG